MTEEKLIRGIGRWDLTALVINCIIGAGIFGLPSKAFALAGSYSLIVCIACALIILLIVVCYAEVASRFDKTGGPYLYAREAFGPLVGFEAAWLYFIVRVSTFAANCNLMVTYLGVFWPGASGPIARLVIIGLVVLSLFAINLIGVRQSSTATNFFTVGKLLPLIVFALLGLFFIDTSNFTFDAVPEYSSLTSAVLLLIYAFFGFENAVIPAGEIKDPQRNVPFALLVGLAVVIAVYVAIQAVTIGTLPDLASSERPLSDAAGVFMGPLGAAFIAAGACISIMGNLNVSLLGTSRILFAMGEENDLPGFLAATQKKFRTPHISLILSALAILLLTVWTSFLSALALATITRLLVYFTTCASLPIFRFRGAKEKAPFVAPMGFFASAASLCLIVWLLTRVDYYKEGLPVVVAVVAGLVIHLAYRAFRGAKGTTTV